MAGYKKNRKDWEDLNITKEEVENISQALKKEEFRKLLFEYAEEITDPKNRKQYQDDIVQLEAERGIDCTFVNPEPGFVVKTSVDGNKKAFINICKNKAVERPTSRPEFRDNSRGISWSIPLCQAPGREDFDKKKNRCVVYDVIFHPDTLGLAEKNPQFKKLVIDTALNAVEESYHVNLDKKNIKLPKLSFKGLPFATVIRKKSKAQPVVSEEDVEFLNKIKYPFKPPKEEGPVVRNLENKPNVGKYTVPKYIIKQQSDIDMQEFTFDKNAKLNAAIPKKLVIEINLPLLSSTQTVNLDIMEKSLHLICEKPCKYKLDIQLPYAVNEETGNAKFDKERRLLVITLPVVKANTTIKDLMKEDSGVESDLSLVGSVSNSENFNTDENNLSDDSKDSYTVEQKFEKMVKIDNNKNSDISVNQSCIKSDYRTTEETETFLEPDKHYLLPGFSCNIDSNNICFVLNVKNVDPSSLSKKLINSQACHIKFLSIGSGFFPINYAFCVAFKRECIIADVICEAWDNNVTVSIEFAESEETITTYYAGLNEDSLVEHFMDNPLELKKIAQEILHNEYDEEDDEDDVDEDDGQNQIDVVVESASVDEVVVNVVPKRGASPEVDPLSKKEVANFKPSFPLEEKSRTLSESGVDDIMVSNPIVRKSILKKRINRSLSESNAEDYVMLANADKNELNSSDYRILEEGEETVPTIKKTVRFSEKIRRQLFRANSTILGRKNKNRKKSRNKKRAMERRLSESENSEVEEKEKDKKKTRKWKQSKKHALVEIVSNSNSSAATTDGEGESSLVDRSGCEDLEKGETVPDGTPEEPSNGKQTEEQRVKPKPGLKKDDKIFEFKSDLIFDLDY